ncbi:hypothetical protein ACFV2L_39980 [Streptomyces sp. NPDC059687]|uniref:DUF7919 family protein n=1 Tax=Streptomyces sp. NPDC059687 TaxID=3346905 RepID=UPI0036771B62
MFYEDLSRYTYADAGEVFSDHVDGMRFVSFRPAYERLNVGWLESGHRWTAGPAPQAFTDGLQAILESQEVNAKLGLHECDLCPASLPDSHPWYTPGRDNCARAKEPVRFAFREPPARFSQLHS